MKMSKVGPVEVRGHLNKWPHAPPSHVSAEQSMVSSPCNIRAVPVHNCRFALSKHTSNCDWIRMKDQMTHYLSIFAETGLFLTAGLVALRYINSHAWGQWIYKGSLKGKVIVVTGANSGIGKSVSAQLAAKGARVIMACRDEGRTLTAIGEIRKTVQDGELVYKHLDLESLKCVKDCVEEISSSEARVDVLICNAGILEGPFKMTVDGYERHFQVNHLAHAVMQVLLLPKLLSNATTENPAKIVSVTSSLAIRGYISESDFIKNSLREVGFNREKAYPKTKLYSFLFNRELAQKLREKPVIIYSASPGFVLTNLARHKSISWFKYALMAPVAAIYLRTAHQGAQSILEAAFPSHQANRDLPTGSVLRNCLLDTRLNTLTDEFDGKTVYKKTLEILSTDSEIEQVLRLLQVK